jgi:hypothetical protein
MDVNLLYLSRIIHKYFFTIETGITWLFHPGDPSHSIPKISRKLLHMAEVSVNNPSYMKMTNQKNFSGASRISTLSRSLFGKAYIHE